MSVSAWDFVLQELLLHITQVCKNKKNQTHIAASQLSVSSGTDHVVGDQAAPPVTPGASGLADHREQGLLQDVSNRTSSFGREQDIQI